MMMTEYFVDANVFLDYLLGDKRSKRVLAFIKKYKKRSATSMTVLSEVKYKLLWILASRKLKTTKKYEIIEYIKRNKQFREDVYATYLDFYIFLVQHFTILNETLEDEFLSCSLSHEDDILPKDAMILALMLRTKIPKLVTFDSDFDDVKLVEVVKL